MAAACDDPSAARLECRNWLNLVAYVLNSVIAYSSLTGIFGETNTNLSDRYHTLVTPAGFAFSIWGPVFIWEGVFAVAQMLPRFRGSPTVLVLSPWWWGACLWQCGWTVAFAQEVIPLSLILMLSILSCLLGASVRTDRLEMSWAEYLCLRAPFSLHLGWIICASAVNTNVQFDASKAAPQVMLAVAVLTFVAVVMLNAMLAMATERPEVITSLVAAWAFLAISSELRDGEKLAGPSRHNPYEWPAVVLRGLGVAAAVASFGMLVLALSAAARSMRHMWIQKQGDAAVDAQCISAQA